MLLCLIRLKRSFVPQFTTVKSRIYNFKQLRLNAILIPHLITSFPVTLLNLLCSTGMYYFHV
jgi:hypothetical protein